jgi:hypothetical protein
LDLSAEDLARAARVDMAESALHAPAAEFGGMEFYADLASKAAVLASRIIRNHPLPGLSSAVTCKGCQQHPCDGAASMRQPTHANCSDRSSISSSSR